MLEEHLAAVRLRLRRIDEAGDIGAALEPEALAEARWLEQLLGEERELGAEVATVLAARVAVGRLYWLRSRSLPAEGDRERAVRVLGPCFLAGADGVPAPLLPDLAGAAVPEAERELREALDAGDPEALRRAADLWRRILAALPADHPCRVRHLSGPGIALLGRYHRTAEPSDLDAAIDALREAVAETPVGHPERGAHLGSLRNALMVRFGRLADIADLEGAIAAGSEAAETAPDGLPERPVALCHVAVALQTRAQHTGEAADLDRAIELLQCAVDGFPAHDPSRLSALANLGNALRARYQQTGGDAGLGDLDTAVTTGKEVLAATPVHHPQRAARLSNLGLALLLRFDATANAADLYTSIDLLRSALAIMPDDGRPTRPAVLDNLGLALWSRYLRTRDAADLAAAAREFRAAARATAEDDPTRARYLSHLGNVLRLRFTTTGDRADLDTAIDALRSAVAASPAGLPDTAAYGAQLGDALRHRFGRTGDPADRDTAVAAYTKAADAGAAAPTVRATAASAAGRLLAATAPGRAADLLETAVRTLPDTAPRQPDRDDRQRAPGAFDDLSEDAGLSDDAASLALADLRGTPGERAARALRLLEAGRTTLLSRAPDVHGGLAGLRAAHPETAARFAALRDRLDRPAGDGTGRGTPTAAPLAADRQRLVRERRELAAEFAATLAEIRALDGFAAFGLPPTTRELLAEAAHGPIVAFSVSEHHCDALLLTKNGIASVALPRLRQDTLTHTVASFHQALHTAAASPHRRRQRAAQAALHTTLEWLWDVAAEPVLRALGHHGPPAAGGDWPRVWWAPGSLLGRLPLHAAGHHGDPEDAPERRTVLDRVVSSYTPTVGALRHARQQRDGQQQDGQPRDGLPLSSSGTVFPDSIGTLWPVDDRLSVADALRADGRPTALALHHTVRALRDRLPHAPSRWAAFRHTGA
ncbi:CHAT domain-containing protein [Streptomyces piniterrae]|uniref:CHAT domain-containing protein n=1 Tax=Streptomyces piniterrae TaxID=2571125 RepID=A0A4U0NRF0_9ACTN|nr:CHAT domain-containing protein [Streptomyces piniterrae]TJZ57077.1 CHAT domain-containing protein [Streptomyces piniterrae]